MNIRNNAGEVRAARARASGRNLRAFRARRAGAATRTG